jgi:hypothetical protein
MQYLNVIQGLHQQHLHKSLPDCVKLIPQLSRIRAFWYEGLNGFDFLCATSFNSARVVKYESRIAIEDQFIIDVMVATLGGLLARFWVTIRHIHLMLGRPERIQHSTDMIDKRLTLPSAAWAMRLRIVVFPAFGRPMISARNRTHFSLSLS